MISISFLFEVDTSKLTAEQKKAYRDEIKAAHPDKGGSSEKFQKVTSKWESISKPPSMIQNLEGMFGRRGNVRSHDNTSTNEPIYKKEMDEHNQRMAHIDKLKKDMDEKFGKFGK